MHQDHCGKNGKAARRRCCVYNQLPRMPSVLRDEVTALREMICDLRGLRISGQDREEKMAELFAKETIKSLRKLRQLKPVVRLDTGRLWPQVTEAEARVAAQLPGKRMNHVASRC